MKSIPKPILSLVLLVALAGCATGAPSKLEQKLYHVDETYQTNIVPVAVIERIGTNNVIVGTNYAAFVKTNYHFEPRPELQAVAQTGGAIATGFGAPWAVPLIGLLWGAYTWWAEKRNSDKKKLNTTLGQNIETSLEVVEAQPNGRAIAEKLKEEIKAQQVNAGVKKMAAEVHDERVNNLDAKESAERVMKPSWDSLPLP